MRKRDWELLFSKYDLRKVLDAQLAKVSDAVLKVPKSLFDAESNELLAAQVASDLAVAPLELLEDEISVSSRDTKVDVSGDRDRHIRDRSQPFYIDGIEVTYHLPFRGDPELLRCRPNSYTLNPPRAVMSGGELRFPYARPDRNVAATKAEFEQDLATIKQWLPRVNDQVKAYNGSLEAAVRLRVEQRRGELSKTDDDLATLGFKVRSSAPNESAGGVPRRPASEVRAQRTQKRERAQREYDVALSFAGEDRQYVEQVAEQLQAMGVSVFYDRFEQVNLWGKDLAEHLGEVYGKNSRFVVLFVSRAYASRAWPKHEKRFAIGAQLGDARERILPVRFDNTEIPGLPPTIGYLDLSVLTPEKLAELIRQKIDDAKLDSEG